MSPSLLVSCSSSSAAVQLRRPAGALRAERQLVQAAPRRATQHRLSHRLRAVEDDKSASGSTVPQTAPETGKKASDDLLADPQLRLATWQYGKTIQDGDLKTWYIGLMFVPFLALMSLPFLPSF